MNTLAIAYFPPISYISLLAKGDVLLECCENYQKQSWRNRCHILAAGGVEALQVPVVHDGSKLITDIKVDWSKGFMRRHQRAIDSAYMNSAYFEHYRDGLYSILDSRIESLWELDMRILDYFLNILEIPSPGITSSFHGPVMDIHPKHEDKFYVQKNYFQVFSEKYGFTPNLSVMDLVFNEGPDSSMYLGASIY